MSIASSEGEGAYFVRSTLRKDRTCDSCGAALRRGGTVLVGAGSSRRRFLCIACGPPGEGDGASVRAAALVVASSPATLPTASARGSIAVWVAVGLLGTGALLASRTGRRFVVTGWVGIKALAKAAVARAGGRRNGGPEVVRHAFEELGPTYVKLGQLVASSQGLFPERYSLEFRRCLDRVRPFEFADVERTLDEELGGEAQAAFAWIDRQPLASASIAQVHAARLKDGQDVVLKVRRPRIGKLVEADLRLLRLAARAMELAPRGELANPVGVVDEFAANIREELDFRLEAEAMREFNRIMTLQGQSRVTAPRVLAALSTERVLVMERFFGRRIDDVEAGGGAPPDAEERLLLGMRAWFQCLILHGFFHGDVHAGNLMALDDGRIGFMDFGIVGRFSRERREQVTDYLLALATGDFRRLAEVMVAMGSIARDTVDLEELTRGLAQSFAPLFADASAPMKYADIVPTILETGVRHGLRMPREFVLLVKQMLYFDRYAKRLAPNLNVFRDPRIISALMADVMAARSPLAA